MTVTGPTPRPARSAIRLLAALATLLASLTHGAALDWSGTVLVPANDGTPGGELIIRPPVGAQLPRVSVRLAGEELRMLRGSASEVRVQLPARTLSGPLVMTNLDTRLTGTLAPEFRVVSAPRTAAGPAPGPVSGGTISTGSTSTGSAGSRHSLATDSSGNVWAWGDNEFGQLGDGTTTNRSNPVPVCSSGSGATCSQLNISSSGSISTGHFHSLATDGSGKVWAWGSNVAGELGDGTTTNRSNPVAVCSNGSGLGCSQLNISSSGSIIAGASHSLAVDNSDKVWAWGWNQSGQLGDGTTTDRSNPVRVCSSGSGSGCSQLNIGSSGSISAGNFHSLAVDSSGKVWAWGSNHFGQLGDGTYVPLARHFNPVPVCSSGSGATCSQLDIGSSGSIIAGSRYSLAVDNGGKVWAWGHNGGGQLGDGTTTYRSNPVPVCSSGSGASCSQLDISSSGSISAGDFHSLATDSSGKVWAWGSNRFGQLGDGLGDGTFIIQSNPVRVCSSGSGKGCSQLNIGSSGSIIAGLEHSLVTDSSGKVWAWGLNGSGQLGDGTNTDRSNPVPVILP